LKYNIEALDLNHHMPARRASDIAPFRVMAILAEAQALERQGRDIIHMEVGEPDFPTPAPVVEAGIAAMRSGLTHYTPALGLPTLREAIASYYQSRYGVQVLPDRVCVTTGASGALLLAMAALFEPGDEILMADPGYPCNRTFARLIEARSVRVPVGLQTRFQLSANLVAAHWGPQTRGVLVANPGNPTGTLISSDELKAIHDFVRARGGWLLVDEIYHELVYDASPSSAAELGDDVIVINSFSKYFQMTGWRLGWFLAPPALVPAVDRLAQNLFLAPPTVAQHAALAAFSTETRTLLEANKAELGKRRDWLLPELARLGFDLPIKPEGAFYVYAGLNPNWGHAEALSSMCLQQAGVAMTPGTDFGTVNADRFVRFAYTTHLDRIQEAVSRLGRVLRS